MPADRDLREDGPTSTPQDGTLPRGKSGTSLADQLQERREDIAMAICRAECDPESDFDFHDDMDCRGKAADAVVTYLRAALREAGQYEQVEGAVWDHQRGIVMYGVKPGALGVDWRPLYRKSTEAGPGPVTRCAGRSAVAHAPTLMVAGRCPVCGEVDEHG